jgi:hypothetical protein
VRLPDNFVLIMGFLARLSGLSDRRVFDFRDHLLMRSFASENFIFLRGFFF